MSCVYEAENLDFKCISEIITKIRNGSVDVTLARMILKQIDSGLSLFGFPTDPPMDTATLSEFDLQAQTIQLELLMDQVTETAVANSENMPEATRIPILQIIAILLEIWKQLEPILNPPKP